MQIDMVSLLIGLVLGSLITYLVLTRKNGGKW